MTYPRITVVTPSLNQGEYIEATIRSVLDQGYPNLEYIIIDGGSTDGTLPIIRKYASRLAYWASEPDAGLYDAVQKGFGRATGQILAWLNSDDLYHPRAFFVVAEIFDRFDEVRWIQGMPSSFDEAGRTVAVRNFRKWHKLDQLSEPIRSIQQESCFWRRSLWEETGARFDGRLKLAGDFELWSRFFQRAELFCVRTVLAGFRVRGANQLSRDRREEYLSECRAIISERIRDLNREESKMLLQMAPRPSFASRLLGCLQSIGSGGRPRSGAQVPRLRYPPALIFNTRSRVFEKE